jgi:hypothetical protein
MKFHVDIPKTFWVLLHSGEKLSMKKKTKGNNLKLWGEELSFLCTAHLLGGIYPPMKFHVDIWKAFWVMFWTKIKFEK